MIRLHLRLTEDTTDARLVRWITRFASAALLVLVHLSLPGRAATALEFLVGAGLGVLTAALLVVMGTLTAYEVELPREAGVSASWRWPGYLCHGLGLLVLGGGFAVLAELELGRLGFMIAILTVLSASLAVLCLGSWLSLLRAVEG